MKAWVLVYVAVAHNLPVTNQTMKVSVDMEPFHSKQGCELTGSSSIQSVPENLAVTYLCVEQEIPNESK